MLYNTPTEPPRAAPTSVEKLKEKLDSRRFAEPPTPKRTTDILDDTVKNPIRLRPRLGKQLVKMLKSD